MAMERENRPVRGGGKRRKKVCQFCADKCECIDYKDAAKLRRFISERSKILPRRTTGTCAMRTTNKSKKTRPARRSCFFTVLRKKPDIFTKNTGQHSRCMAYSMQQNRRTKGYPFVMFMSINMMP